MRTLSGCSRRNRTHCCCSEWAWALFSTTVFPLLWSCDKAESDTAAKIFQVFYKIPFSTTGVYVIGGIEALLSILVNAGAWKSYTYAIGLALYTISTIASWRQLISPIGQGHHLFVAGILVLTAFIAPSCDTLWALDNLPAIHSEHEAR